MCYSGNDVRKFFLGLIIICIIAAGLTLLTHSWRSASVPTADTSRVDTDHKQKQSTDSFDKTRYSLTDPTSIWVIVNKQHPLTPISYAPDDLVTPSVTLRVPGQQEMEMRRAAADALEQMFAGAANAGYKLKISTAYRGYNYQKTLYDQYAARDGQAKADTYSARPGYSEHQTGLAVDIRNQVDTCSLNACFGATPEGKWLAANAYRYGFLVRYPADKEAVTGYEYEPWHFRYIGTDLSIEMHKQGVETLEEFFNVSGGTTYKPIS